MQFEPGHIYVRKSKAAPGKLYCDKVFIRETGCVREVRPGLVLMDVTGPFPGVETFNPAHETGWQRCG